MDEPQKVDRRHVNRQKMAREIVWLAPVAAITLSATWTLIRMADGDRIATILALPLTILAIVVGRLVARHVGLPRAPRNVPRLAWAVSATLTAAPLLVAALLPGGQPQPRPQSSEHGLASSDIAPGATVRIGYNGQLPGWSSVSSDTAEPLGFDIELGRYLAREFKWGRVEWVRVTQEERMTFLQGAARKVDLVISNFSINASRRQAIDMAGPYYRDTTSAAFNEDKFVAQAVAGAITICATSGTTSKTAAQLLAKLRGQSIIKVRIETRASLQECESSLHGTGGSSAVMSDWSMLKAFGQHRVAREPDSFEEVPPEDQQLYGVGLPNNSRDACRQISDKINSFLREDSSQPVSPWRSTFGETLAPSALDVTWHKPTSADHAYCDQ